MKNSLYNYTFYLKKKNSTNQLKFNPASNQPSAYRASRAGDTRNISRACSRDPLEPHQSLKSSGATRGIRKPNLSIARAFI